MIQQQQAAAVHLQQQQQQQQQQASKAVLHPLQQQVPFSTTYLLNEI